MSLLRGVIVPVAVPLNERREPDLVACGRLIDLLLASGVHRIFANGSMGAFAPQNRVLRFALGGWQSAGIVTLQTGFPFTVLVGGDIPNIGAGASNTRASLTGDARAGERPIDRWFNKEAFAPPPPFTFGTAGRNILDGPGNWSFDLTLMKLFTITEGRRLQFRAEFFNAFNHPNYGLPNAQVGSPACGTIRSADNREMQLGLKYIF